MNIAHFFIPIELSFPGRKRIMTFAFIDSGTTNPHISEKFASRHSLPRSQKSMPIPIYAIDHRPLNSGLLTHDVIASLKVRDHSEKISLGIVQMPYPVLLGLDWLKLHNPSIDWACGQLSLSCCGTNHDFPVSAFGKGYGLAHLPPSLSSAPAISSVGLGLCLNGKSLSTSVPDFIQRAEPVHTQSRGRLANVSAIHSILCPVRAHTGLSRTELLSIWTSHVPSAPDSPPPGKPLNICFISSVRFSKYSRNRDTNLIWYTPNGVRQVLDRLCDASLFTNAKKCEFSKSQVEYLGYIISSKGVQMNPKKLDTITKWPLPTSVREIQSFLGFTKFYRKFVHNYAKITFP
jgi:hypothetical protein